MPKYTPTKDDTRSPLSPHNSNNGKSPKSPSNITKQSNRASFATPQYFPQKIAKFSPKSASKAAITSAGKKKKFNFDNPKVKKLLDKLSKKTSHDQAATGGEGAESSNLNRLKRLLFRKKNKQALQKDKENIETEYTFTECSDDANSLYFGTEMSSDGELSEEELDLAYGLEHLDSNGIMMSPPTKRPSMLAASSRSSMAFSSSGSERKIGLSLQHLFTKRREEQKRAEDIIEKFDIKKQLESDLSVADTIFGKWQRENEQQ
ncbi:hypothetical protein FDP41_010578 [Naegleria fowleri]|uniref:Uncharacterized protein n=1 Tax=Naegleria fowleri TaxID=5763 RepID=A0A6A5BZD3_NAEFO|nr:uncharacterized protein FDP41_010578 [Naegleria fowleri]KAF0983513.1 hypothetical protein FDP41_010578 [Naegleria fowleri]CAG4708644.1 unnamed protein product [Naegleria fowleri]